MDASQQTLGKKSFWTFHHYVINCLLSLTKGHLCISIRVKGVHICLALFWCDSLSTTYIFGTYIPSNISQGLSNSFWYYYKVIKRIRHIFIVSVRIIITQLNVIYVLHISYFCFFFFCFVFMDLGQEIFYSLLVFSLARE